jgi:hypothetical protein
VEYGVGPDGTEDDEPDFRALERRPCELLHIGFWPHSGSIGGTPSRTEGNGWSSPAPNRGI